MAEVEGGQHRLRRFVTAGAAESQSDFGPDRRQVKKSPGVLGQVRRSAHRAPNRARQRREQPGQRPKQRRLAGAVRAEQGHDLARRTRQRDAIQDGLARRAGRTRGDVAQLPCGLLEAE